jgi:sarcosine oxidase subunit beta
VTQDHADVIVIGGGLHGLSAALHLARAGKRVAILERAWVGRHASGATAAGVRTLGRDLSEVPISLEAMDMWHRIETIVGDSCGFHAHGQIRAAESEKHLVELNERAATLRQLGYAHEEIIDRTELRRLVPALSPHCVGALIARRDGAADPHRALSAYRRSCEAAGVQIHEGCGVTAIERHGADWLIHAGERSFIGPAIVNAAGAWAARVAAFVGDDIALGMKASMMIVTERLAPLLDPVVSAVGRSLSFKQSGQGTLVIGGGLQGSADLDTQRSAVDYRELAKGARAATELFPCVRDVRIIRTWVGMEAKTRDLLPVIGPSPNAPGVVHAFGFSGHGFQLVPVVGAIVCDLLLHGKTGRQIDAFAAERLMARKAAA